MTTALLCAQMRSLIQAYALKALNPSSRQAMLSYDYRGRQIAFLYPCISAQRLERIAQKHAVIWIENPYSVIHHRAIRRGKRDRAERQSNAALREMRLALEAIRAA